MSPSNFFLSFVTGGGAETFGGGGGPGGGGGGPDIRYKE